MRAALKLLEHLIGLFERSRFAEYRLFKTYQRVGRKDQRIREFLGHGPGFAVRVDLRCLRSGQLAVKNLRHCRRNDLKVKLELTQQFSPARRTGCQNKWRQDHACSLTKGMAISQPPA